MMENKMISSKVILKEIIELTSKVIDSTITDKEKFPCLRLTQGYKIIGIEGVEDFSIALKNMKYGELYKAMFEAGFYNFRFVDGGLVQLLYEFSPQDELIKHKLAYFPSPDFESFQNEPEVYIEDNIYAEILDPRVLPVPIRFDYDGREDVYKELTHPKSHLTLGQYKNCRIPVCSPITPTLFIDFIMRSFYNTALLDLSGKLNFKFSRFQPTATELERDRIHIRITP